LLKGKFLKLKFLFELVVLIVKDDYDCWVLRFMIISIYDFFYFWFDLVYEFFLFMIVSFYGLVWLGNPLGNFVDIYVSSVGV